MPGTVFLPNAGPLGTLIAMELATVVMLIISYNYSYMIQKFPMTGGEFIYAKSAFGNIHGFLCAWFLSLSYLCVIPLNATALNLIMRAVFGEAFMFGFHYTVAGYHVYFGEMLLAVGALMVFMLLTSGGVHITGELQTILVMILIAGIGITAVSGIISPLCSAEKLQPMFHPRSEIFNRGVTAQILAVAVTGPQSFVGFDTVPQLMEETKFSVKRVKVLMDTCIISGGLVYIVLTLFACVSYPENYGSWVEYIDDLPKLSGINGIATLNGSHEILGKAGLGIIFSSVIAAMLTGILGFYTATSRLLYSMARDGMIPSWFSRLNGNGVPVSAGLFCTVISGITCLLGRAVMGWVFDMASIGASVGFAYTSISACKYAYLEKRKDIVIFGVLGFILSLGMALLLLVPLPGLNVSLGSESYILLIVWIVLGGIFYYRRKLHYA